MNLEYPTAYDDRPRHINMDDLFGRKKSHIVSNPSIFIIILLFIDNSSLIINFYIIDSVGLDLDTKIES